MKYAPLHVYTPTIYSESLSKITGKDVWLKLENCQPGGSYKIRGIGKLCQHYVYNESKNNLISSSGGNAGIAVAYCARTLGVNAEIFIPSTSKKIYVDILKQYGANVHIVGKVWDEANNAALDFLANNKGGYVPPFDHPVIWSGHSTIIDEVVNDGIKPDAILVAVGGGGLAAGAIEGMQRHKWHDVTLVAVEPFGAASFAESLKAKKVVNLNKVDTISTSLGAKKITKKLFEQSQFHPVKSILVSDRDSIVATRNFADDHRFLVEPANGASLSVLYNNHKELKVFNSILLVVCGGNGISLSLLEEYMHQFEDSSLEVK